VPDNAKKQKNVRHSFKKMTKIRTPNHHLDWGQAFAEHALSPYALWASDCSSLQLSPLVSDYYSWTWSSSRNN